MRDKLEKSPPPEFEWRSLLKVFDPEELLEGSWKPEDPGPGEVVALARSLLSSPAT